MTGNRCSYLSTFSSGLDFHASPPPWSISLPLRTQRPLTSHQITRAAVTSSRAYDMAVYLSPGKSAIVQTTLSVKAKSAAEAPCCQLMHVQLLSAAAEQLINRLVCNRPAAVQQ
ncbi:uncharacterized protein V6R79_016312 [Siganus canaliculatus]